MKTKNKLLALVEIAIVLCSVLLAAMSAIATEQTTQKVSASEVSAASEDDFVLGIYGNANEDDTIDMRDLTYVKLIFFGKKPETELADAKYDGEINPLDFIQIKLIIVGKEKELTILQYVGYGDDITEKAVTVNMPIERVVVLNEGAAEGVRIVGAKDKIVGISNFAADDPEFWSDMQNTPIVSSDDYESIIELNPQMVINYASFGYKPELEEKLEPAGIKVVRQDFFKPVFLIRDIRTLGILLGKEERAEEFIDFLQGYISILQERVESIDPEEKKRVFFETCVSSEYPDLSTGAKGSAWHTQIVMAGGINIFADTVTPYPKVSPEAVLDKNPEIVIRQMRDRGYTITDPSDMIALRDEIMSRPGWDKLDAVKNNEVYIISNGIAWCGIRKHVGVFYLAKWFYPGLFSDINPEEFHKEWLDEFEGIEYKGIWVYPEE